MTDKLDEMWSQQHDFMKLLQKERGFPEFPTDITSKQGQQFLEGISFHLMKELFEAGQHLRNSKSHRATELPEVDREAYKEELVDVLHLYFEVCLAAGISRDELFEAYIAKGEVNFKRIASGYLLIGKFPFDDWFGDLFGSPGVFSTMSSTMNSSVKKTEHDGTLRSYKSTSDPTGMTLYVDLPGVDPNTVELTVCGSRVVVKGVNRGRQFINTYTVSNDFSTETTVAKLSFGQLEIRLRRAGHEGKVRKINIEIS